MIDKHQACLEKIPGPVGGEGCARDTSNRIWKKFDLSSL